MLVCWVYGLTPSNSRSTMNFSLCQLFDTFNTLQLVLKLMTDLSVGLGWLSWVAMCVVGGKGVPWIHGVGWSRWPTHRRSIRPSTWLPGTTITGSSASLLLGRHPPANHPVQTEGIEECQSVLWKVRGVAWCAGVPC